MLQDLLPQAERIAAKLKARNETISVANPRPPGCYRRHCWRSPGRPLIF